MSAKLCTRHVIYKSVPCKGDPWVVTAPSPRPWLVHSVIIRMARCLSVNHSSALLPLLVKLISSFFVINKRFRFQVTWCFDFGSGREVYPGTIASNHILAQAMLMLFLLLLAHIVIIFGLEIMHGILLAYYIYNIWESTFKVINKASVMLR